MILTSHDQSCETGVETYLLSEASYHRAIESKVAALRQR